MFISRVRVSLRKWSATSPPRFVVLYISRTPARTAPITPADRKANLSFRELLQIVTESVTKAERGHGQNPYILFNRLSTRNELGMGHCARGVWGKPNASGFHPRGCCIPQY